MKRRSRPITFLLDTGARRGEIAGVRVIDIDFGVEVALVLGKGRRERTLPFGRTTALALDRHLRARARHKDATLPWSTRISSATPLPISGSPKAAERPTSCDWPAGSPVQCCSAMAPRRPTLAPARRIAASPPLIGSSSTPTGPRNLHACLTVAAFDVNTERHSRWVSGNRMGLTAQRH
jgi:hypothetical protein